MPGESANNDLLIYLPLAFPIFFAAIWFSVVMLLSALSGWFPLMQHFPDRPEKPLLHLTWQTGTMGFNVGLRRVLKLSVCPSGLRVGILRLFGPFSKDFFVPWDKIEIKRSTFFFMPVAELKFGNPSVGRLTIAASVADRLAAAAPPKRWPEAKSK